MDKGGRADYNIKGWRHCEEQRDEAIRPFWIGIATLPSTRLRAGPPVARNDRTGQKEAQGNVTRDDH